MRFVRTARRSAGAKRCPSGTVAACLRPSLLALAAVLWIPAAPAGIVLPPTVYTVGSGADPECDFISIQQAISAAASNDIIRVTTGTWLIIDALEIYNLSLSVVGGYSDCADTTPDPETPTLITHTDHDSAVMIVGNVFAGRTQVLLRHLQLTGGNGGPDDGGGLDVSGDLEIRLDNVDIYGNDAENGGGIRIHGFFEPTVVLDGGSRIGGTAPFTGDNSATFNGGGIYCDDGEGVNGGAIEWVDASINYNNALNGGGLYLDNCSLTMPNAAGDTFRLVEIRGNQAQLVGGGLRLANGASVNLASQLNRQVRIGNNQAQNGGGVAVDLAQFIGAGVHIEENQATSLGGGVFLDTDASFDLSRGNPTGANCPVRERCATLTRNMATNGGGGGAYALDGSVLDLRQVFLERNTAPSSAAIGVSLATLVLRDVQVAGNTATASPTGNLLLATGGTLDLRHVTLALNTADEALRLNNNGAALVSDSILWQPGATLVGSDGTGSLNGSCNNGSESATLTGAATHAPGFLEGGTPGSLPPLLHLAPGSQNIDSCDLAPAPNPAFDLLGHARIVDDTGVADLAGPLDRGAIEYAPPIFIDGFED